MGGRELIGLEPSCRINSQRASRSSSLPRPFVSAIWLACTMKVWT